MVDYGAMPPEINSGRMYTGAGSSTFMASVAAWQALAAELGVAATSFFGVVDALATGPWLGPSSMSMLSAALPYVTWLANQSAQAEQRSILHGQSAAAFEMAHASVVPPPMIAENRTELATLVATNFMGVNTPAIAANEAEYSEFWAQDATTLYGFAGQAAAITGSMIPFLPPDLSTDPAGLAAQATQAGAQTGVTAGQASSTVGDTAGQMSGMGSGMGSVMSAAPQAMNAIPQALQSMAQGGSQLLSPLTSMLGQFGSVMSPAMGSGNYSSLMGMANGGVGNSVSASMGRGLGLPSVAGGSDGSRAPRMSVPSTWAGAVERDTKTNIVSAATAAEEDTQVAATPRGAMIPAAMGAGNSSTASTNTNNKRYLPRPRVVSYWP